MRSHAKASSAGSILGQGSRRGSSPRGADATRAPSLGQGGRGARSHGRCFGALAFALLALALLVPSAFAAKDVIYSFGTATGSGNRGGEFNGPRDVAVNDSGEGPADVGDVYVADEANNRIQRFSSSGAFVSAWGANVTHRDEVQKVTVKATAGTFTLTFEGNTTDPVVYFANPDTLDDALDVLPSIGGDANVNVTSTGPQGNRVYTVTFTGALTGTNVGQMTADTGSLEGTAEVSTAEGGSGGSGNDYEICTLASKCGLAVASGGNGAAAGNGSLDSPQAVAVDQDTGNVYVSDRDNRRVSEYDGEGNFIRSFGFDVVESGPGDTGTGYEICNDGDGDVCKAGEGGSGVGQYGSGSPASGFGVAVSPADGNASTGTVYLADSGNQRVDTYNLDGASPGNFGSASNFGSEQPLSVAVDSRGVVYASNSNGGGEVERYDSQDANGGGVGFLAPILSPVDEVQKVTFIGFAAGNKFTLTCPNGAPTGELPYSASASGREVIQNGLESACGASSFTTTGNPPNTTVTFRGIFGGANQPQMTCTTISGSGSCSVSTTTSGIPGPLLRGTTSGLAVDPDNDGGGADVDVLYVLRSSSSGNILAQQFGSTASPPGHAPGLTVAPTAADDTHGATVGLSDGQGFGLNSANGRLYVSALNRISGEPFETVHHRVYVLAEASSLSSPSAFTSGAGSIASRTATFSGNANPNGGLVSCKFQYSTDESNWTDVPDPDCASLAIAGTQDVSQAASGLVPNTKYFLRLVVSRPFFPGLAPVISNVEQFTTPPAAPVVSGAKAAALDDTSVRVSATIDPAHSPTSYVVQYGSTPSLGLSTAAVDVGSGSTPLEVSPIIGGLNPNTTYYFKLTASNPTGSHASASLPAATFPAQTDFDVCPNDQFRTGPSAKLPDCRAYEQATPTDKSGSDAFGTEFSVQASNSGDGITFFTFAGFPIGEGFQTSPVFRSSRSGDDWSTEGWLPPPTFGDNAEVMAWTPDLKLSFSRAAVTGSPGTAFVMRQSGAASYTTIVPYSAVTSPYILDGVSADRSKVFFDVEGSVPVTSGPTPDSSQRNLYVYDRDTGELSVAGVLPDSSCGSPPCLPAGGSVVAVGSVPFFSQEGTYGLHNSNSNPDQDEHAVTPAGDVYFYDEGARQLYLRLNAAGPGASTESVSASERTDCAEHDPCSGTPEPDPNGTFPAIFQGATPTGSRAFFSSKEELTDDATTAAGREDLYRFDAAAPVGSRLTDIVPGTEVVGVLGFADDGSHVYFVANADLDGVGPANSGNCINENPGFSIAAGVCSLYLWRDDGSPGGALAYIARLDAREDGVNWIGRQESPTKTSRVSTDGHVLVFRSERNLTGYDSKKTDEYYRYDAVADHLTCLTCIPTGVPPAIDGDENTLPALRQSDHRHFEGAALSYNGQPFLSRNLSSDGDRFFFQTAEKLVPADVNGDQACPEREAAIGVAPACTDVYEWEASGKGSCSEESGSYSPANGGCIYLISTGTGAYPSYLGDVSASGDTVFIFSRDQLVPADGDVQADIYAATVEGGLVSQRAARPPSCEADACRGESSQVPDLPGAGSAVFDGPGDPKPAAQRCPKGKRKIRAKGKVRCVSRHQKRKRNKRAGHRAAANNRRASR